MRNRLEWCCVLLLLSSGCFAKAQQPPTTQLPGASRLAQEDDDRERLLQALMKELNRRPKSDEDELFDLPDQGSPRSIGLGTAARPQPVAPPAPVAELRIYDLADLFAIAPSFEAQGWNGLDSSSLLDANSDFTKAFSAASGPAASTGGFGGMGGMGGGGMGGMGGMFNVTDEVRSDRSSWRPTPTTLMSLIEKSIDGHWDVAGSNESISWIGSSLVISTFPETHTKIQKLLDLLQSRWNARVTFKVHLDWIWLDRKEAMELQGLPLVVEKSLPNAISKSQVDQWMDELPKVESRPKRVHSIVHGHNGQTLAWVSGSQRRTVSNWIREEKGKLSPEVTTISSGVACEVIPMLSHASNAVTISIRSRYLWREPKPDGQLDQTAEMPRPDTDALAGQTINATVRVPVGLAAVVGGGTSIDGQAEGFELYLIVSPELVSAPAQGVRN